MVTAKKKEARNVSPQTRCVTCCRVSQGSLSSCREARCPGNRRGRTWRGENWSHLSLNRLPAPEQSRAGSYRGAPASPTLPHALSLASRAGTRRSPGCRPPTEGGRGVLAARHQLSAGGWLPSCGAHNLKESPLGVGTMVLISPLPSTAGTCF